jgi:glycosyltransferase involved in cell wall biosynthesis
MSSIAAAAGYRVTVMEWDRTGSKPRSEKKGQTVFDRLPMKSPHGLLAILGLPSWFAFVSLKLIVGRYDLVQPRNLDGLLPVALVSRLKRFKVVYDLGDFYSAAYASRVPLLRNLSGLLERSLVRTTDAIVLAGPGQFEQVGVSNLPPNSMIFYNVPFPECAATPHPLSRSPDSLPQKSGTLELLYVGALAFDRTRLLLNAAKAIRGLPVRLTIGGFGEREAEIAQSASNNSQLVFLGRLTHQEVMESTRQCDVSVLPYDARIYNDRMGMPNKLFEAMALGKPVLAQSGTMMGDLVRNYGIGFLTDYTDENSIHESLLTVLKCTKDELRAIGNRAGNVFEQQYNPKDLAKKYLDLLTEALLSVA